MEELKVERLDHLGVISGVIKDLGLIEKVAFEFPLALQEVDMWFDKVEKRWKKGLPPTVGTAGK